MKRSINSKILATAALAVITPSVTNAANTNAVKNTNNAIDGISYDHPNRLKKVGEISISTKGIVEVHNKLISLSDKDRAIVADKMRKDFSGFMNEYFSVNEGENYCLSNTWKTDERCLKFINDAADIIEKGYKLGNVDFDDVGLNTIPFEKRKVDDDVSVGVSYDSNGTVTGTGTYIVHFGGHK